jgi:hypothetical protein
MTPAKRHHYLPVFYLAGFCGDDGKLTIFDEQKSEFRRSTPENTQFRNRYYDLLDAQGRRLDTVEDNLAVIEGRAASALRGLESGEAISMQERFDISLFMGLLACRTPAFERIYCELLTRNAQLAMKRALQAPNLAEVFGREPPPGFREFLDSGAFRVQPHQNERVDVMFEQGPKIGKAFFCQQWTVLRSLPGSDFVTCDDPFAIVSSVPSDLGLDRYGIASPEVTTTLPVSARTCLAMTGEGVEIRQQRVKSGTVRRINIATALKTDRFAIAAVERHLRGVVRLAGLGPQRAKPKVAVEEYPHPSGDPSRAIRVTGMTSEPRKPGPR